jgi:hypothetical protein
MKIKCLVGAVVSVSMLGAGVGRAAPPTQFVSSTIGPIELNKTYTTKADVKLVISWWKTDTELESWGALVGPFPAAGCVSFKVVNSQFAQGQNLNLAPALQVVLTDGSGFIYMAGIQPYGGTDGGSSISDGTSMLVQRQALPGDQTFHRFFRLESDHTVRLRNVPELQQMPIPFTADYRYFDRVISTQNKPGFGVQKSIPAKDHDDAIGTRAFVKAVLERAHAANLEVPDLPDDP